MATSAKSFNADGDAAAAAAAEALCTPSFQHNSGHNDVAFSRKDAQCCQLALAKQQRQHEADLQLVREQATQEVTHLRQELSQQQASFHRDTQALQAKSNALEAQLHEARLRLFANLGRGPYIDEEDSKIMDDVRILHQRLWAWARANSVPQMNAVCQAVIDAPTHFATRFVEAGVDHGRFFDPARPVGLKRLPALILAALVAEDIYAVMFCNPFFFLNCVGPYPQVDRQEALCNTVTLLDNCTSPLPHTRCLSYRQGAAAVMIQAAKVQAAETNFCVSAVFLAT
jgi:hypothetical protein